jgi:hypothetical protein
LPIRGAASSETVGLGVSHIAPITSSGASASDIHKRIIPQLRSEVGAAVERGSGVDGSDDDIAYDRYSTFVYYSW